MDMRSLEQQKLSCVSVLVGVCACVCDACACLTHTLGHTVLCELILIKGMSI